MNIQKGLKLLIIVVVIINLVPAILLAINLEKFSVGIFKWMLFIIPMIEGLVLYLFLLKFLDVNSDIKTKQIYKISVGISILPVSIMLTTFLLFQRVFIGLVFLLFPLLGYAAGASRVSENLLRNSDIERKVKNHKKRE